MPNRTISVLVVDDSALLREQLCDLISAADGLEVAGSACDGRDALNKIPKLNPDVVTLDVHMPKMDGLATLDAILTDHPLPVIMVSALTQRAADVTLEALERGAMDYVAKPESLTAARGRFREELIHKIRTMAGTNVEQMLRIRRARAQRSSRTATPKVATTSKTDSSLKTYEDCCLAIGISTGGPPALSELFQAITPPMPPVVVVQHMPANFTGPFAARLDRMSQLSVKEAEAGDTLQPNQALISPGGKHLRLRRCNGKVVARIVGGQPVSSHKPSVDVMMGDAAEVYGARCLGVIMTGMGHDGAAGCGAIRAAGGYVLGQDENSSDVYGMNKVAFTAGNVDRQFSLSELPELLRQQCRRMFPATRSAAAISSR